MQTAPERILCHYRVLRTCQDSCKYLVKKDLYAFANDRTAENVPKERASPITSPKSAKSR